MTWLTRAPHRLSVQLRHNEPNKLHSRNVWGRMLTLVLCVVVVFISLARSAWEEDRYLVVTWLNG